MQTLLNTIISFLVAYPALHSHQLVTYEIVNQYSLLYKVQGKLYLMSQKYNYFSGLFRQFKEIEIL